MERSTIDQLITEIDNLKNTLIGKQNEVQKVQSSKSSMQNPLKDSGAEYHVNSALEAVVNEFNNSLSSIGSLENKVNGAISEINNRINSLKSDINILSQARNRSDLSQNYASGESYIQKNIELYNNWKNDLLTKLNELKGFGPISSSGSIDNIVGNYSTGKTKYSNVTIDEQINYYAGNNKNYGHNKNYDLPYGASSYKPQFVTEVQKTMPSYKKELSDYLKQPSAQYLNKDKFDNFNIGVNLSQRLYPQYNSTVNNLKKFYNLNIDGKYNG